VNQLAELAVRQVLADVRLLQRRVRTHTLTTPRWQRAISIDELRSVARRAVPRAVFDFVDGAASDEVTADRNLRDFVRLALNPRVLTGAGQADISTTALGHPINLPMIGAPTGLTGLAHPDGELGVARAVHQAGSIYVLSAVGSYSIEEVAAGTPGPLWFQVYIWRDRGRVAALLERARAAGFLALVLTVDVPRAAVRERDIRNGFGVPPRLTLRTCTEGLMRPRWSSGFARRPRLTAATVAEQVGGSRDPVSLAEFMNRQYDPGQQWRDLTWLREHWAGPLVVKGILRADDARRAVQLGADAVVVSNHGGRQLDHAPSAVSVLPRIVDAVGDTAEVYLDSGIRRGSDVVKAIALGARACLVGRPLIYGLAAGGTAGARRAMQLLSDELELALVLTGCPTVTTLDRTWLLGVDPPVGLCLPETD
jgi:isopentenyl diphosphate isomerase/L-lactate dehydrogenase-like FMN-dependent dehydrogenase